MTKAQRAKAIENAARELMDAINRLPRDQWAASFAASDMAVALAEPVDGPAEGWTQLKNGGWRFRRNKPYFFGKVDVIPPFVFEAGTRSTHTHGRADTIEQAKDAVESFALRRNI